MTFWQQRLTEAELTISGLELMQRSVAEPLQAILAEADMNLDHPYSRILHEVQSTGMLDHSMWPGTGTNLLGWDVNYQINLLRAQWPLVVDLDNKENLDKAEPKIAQAAQRISELVEQFWPAIERQEQERVKAQKTLDYLAKHRPE